MCEKEEQAKSSCKLQQNIGEPVFNREIFFETLPLRKGKWTKEEEIYCERLIAYFNRGALNLPEGTMLRAYLSKKLHCDPMRISKKFIGPLAIGKKEYRMQTSSTEEIEYARHQLQELEGEFLAKCSILRKYHTNVKRANSNEDNQPPPKREKLTFLGSSDTFSHLDNPSSLQPQTLQHSKVKLNTTDSIESIEPRLNDPNLRKGKWTVPEEIYAEKLIYFFNRQILQIPEGTTLRSFLSEKLHCDPMRISKKFTGSYCIGKKFYHQGIEASEEERAEAYHILRDLERIFFESLRDEENQNVASLMCAKSPVTNRSYRHNETAEFYQAKQFSENLYSPFPCNQSCYGICRHPNYSYNLPPHSQSSVNPYYHSRAFFDQRSRYPSSSSFYPTHFNYPDASSQFYSHKHYADYTSRLQASYANGYEYHT